MNIIIYLLESSICLGVCYLFYRGILQNQTSYRYNRGYLLLMSALSFVLPWLDIPLGIDSGAMNPVRGGYLLLEPAGMEVHRATETMGIWSWQYGVGLVYGVGVLCAGGYYGHQLLRICKLIRKGRPQADSGEYRLIYTDGQFPTASFLNYLLWDNTQGLTPAEQRHMIAHEEMHIRQKHSYDVLYLTLLKTLFWFHPLIYLYDKALIENHEFAADAGALHHPGSDRRTYVRLLARQSVQPVELQLVNHFYKSKTLKRIKMMDNHTKTPWYRLALTAPIVLALFFVFACQEEDEMQKLDNLQTQYDNAQTDEEKAQLSDADDVFMVVEDQPTPEMGMTGFYEYVKTNLVYPAQARRMGIEGKVFVQFVVDKDGALTDVQVIKGIGAGCDAEAARVIQEAAPWNPGQQRGKFVKVRMVLPITFRLGDELETPPDQPEVIREKMQVSNFSIEGNTMSGIIEDKNGNPLAGANVIVRGTTTGTVTNLQGRFRLSHERISENGVTVSFVGYESYTVGN